MICRAELAQSVEQLICNQQVAGSSPVLGSIEKIKTTQKCVVLLLGLLMLLWSGRTRSRTVRKFRSEL